MMSYIVILSGVLAVSHAVIHNGKCPDIKVVENFDLAQYSGTWYGLKKFPYEAEKNFKCASSEYSKVSDHTLAVKHSFVMRGVRTVINGTAVFTDDALMGAKMVMTLQLGEEVKESPMLVLGTDYANYAVVYSCRYDERSNNHQTTAWILSRSKTLTSKTAATIDRLIQEHPHELDSRSFLDVDLSEPACRFTNTTSYSQSRWHPRRVVVDTAGCTSFLAPCHNKMGSTPVP